MEPLSEKIPEPDRIEGAPHPRETTNVFGHEAAQSEFLAAFNTGHLHHGWMITGPRGVGKATLAWHLARFLLATSDSNGGMSTPPNINIPEDHPVTRRMRALAEPRLFLLRRAWDDEKKRLKTAITVDEVRRMKSFFSLSAADGGSRVAIIDAADELNTSAANALLKLLEEPPANVTLFLISHQPFKLLPTIRSRCRELRLHPLATATLANALIQARATLEPDDAQALNQLAGGSVGEAFRLTNLSGLALYQSIVTLFSSLPRLDRPRLLALIETGAQRDGEAKFDLILTLLDLFLARIARAGATRTLPPEAATGEADIIARLAPDAAAAHAWAELAQTLGLKARRGKAVNLDPATLLMDMVLRLEDTAAALPKR